jgi:hypothetical protein
MHNMRLLEYLAKRSYSWKDSDAVTYSEIKRLSLLEDPDGSKCVLQTWVTITQKKYEEMLVFAM